MFDHQHAVARFGQALQNADELVHVCHVQPGRRLVQDIKRLACRAAAELRRQLHALRLAAGKGRRCLPQLHVSQADVVERFELAADALVILEEGDGFLDVHVQHVGDILALVGHFQRLAVVAFALAHVARHENIRQEVHFDFQHPVAAAVFAPPALDVEGEAVFLVAARLRFGGGGKDLANLVKQPGVRRRIRPGRAPDGALVNADDFVQLLHALHAAKRAGTGFRAVQHLRQVLVKDFVHQAGFARPRHARHAAKAAQRHFHVNVLEIMLLRAADGQEALRLTAHVGNLDAFFARQVLPGDAVRIALDILHRAFRDDVAAVDARARPDVHNPVRRVHRVLVVLDDNQRVAQVAHFFQGVNELHVVALMQANRRLIQNIQHAHER